MILSMRSLVSIEQQSPRRSCDSKSTQTLILSKERSDSTQHSFLGFLLVKFDHVTYRGELTFFAQVLKNLLLTAKIQF